MLVSWLYFFIKFVIGNIYPAYKTWKALKRKDDTTRRRWMKYWVSFSAFQLAEIVADMTLAYVLPLYYEIKLVLLMWIVLGSGLFFDSIVNRELAKREKTIDRFLRKTAKARDDVIATIWFELTRCSVRIFTLLMTGGLSIVVDLNSDNNNNNHQIEDKQAYEPSSTSPSSCTQDEDQDSGMVEVATNMEH